MEYISKSLWKKKLKCTTDVLFLIKEKLIYKTIKDKILNSDLIYVGGGNTLRMMKIWTIKGVDKLLKKAHNKGIVLSGLSAGSICWFKYGLSDSIPGKWTRVKGFGIIKAINNPHYGYEKGRIKGFKNLMKKNPKVIGVAIGNFCAVEFINNKYKIITSKKEGKAYKFFLKKNKINIKELKNKNKFESIKSLLKN